MKVFFYLFMLAIVGCKNAAKNEITVTPIQEHKILPALSGDDDLLSVNQIRNVHLGLDASEDSYTSLLINLNDSESTADTSNYLKDKIRRWLYDDLNGEEGNIHFEMGDERLNQISRWKDVSYYPIEEILSTLLNDAAVLGDYSYQMGLSLKRKDEVESISNIVVGTYLYNSEESRLDKIGSQLITKFEGENEQLPMSENYLPLIYQIAEENIHGGYLVDAIQKRDEMFIRLDDYKINYLSGLNRRFSDIKENYQKNYSLLIVSYKDHLKFYYISSGNSLKKTLHQKGYHLYHDINGHLVALNSIQNSLSLPIDWNNLSFEDLDRGRWQIYGAKTIFAPLEAGKVYVVAHDTVRNIAKKKTTTVTYQGSFLSLPNLSKGDILEFEIQGKYISPTFEVVSKEVDYKYIVGGSSRIEISPGVFNRVGFISNQDYSVKKACTVWHRQFSGNSESSMMMNSTLLQNHFQLMIGGKRYQMKDLLFDDNGIAFLNAGKVAKWRVKIPEDSKRTLIMMNVPGKAYQTEVGFSGWKDCPSKEKKGFSVINYSLEKRTYDYMIQGRYLGGIKVLSAL